MRSELINELLSTAPSPADVRDARKRAGLTNAQCAQLFGYRVSERGISRAWEQKETEGVNGRAMSAAEWNYFLLVTGQHPTLTLRRR